MDQSEDPAQEQKEHDQGRDHDIPPVFPVGLEPRVILFALPFLGHEERFMDYEWV